MTQADLRLVGFCFPPSPSSLLTFHSTTARYPDSNSDALKPLFRPGGQPGPTPQFCFLFDLSWPLGETLGYSKKLEIPFVICVNEQIILPVSLSFSTNGVGIKTLREHLFARLSQTPLQSSVPEASWQRDLFK